MPILMGKYTQGVEFNNNKTQEQCLGNDLCLVFYSALSKNPTFKLGVRFDLKFW